jgi:hypothetical protein
MSIEKRRYIRFSLNIPATRYTRYGEAVTTVLNQISISGCLAEWDENVYVGEEFRLIVQLPDKNFLPLKGKALYQFADNGIGTTFLDTTQFEQELLSQIISYNLEKQGLSLHIDPFAQPKNFNKNEVPTITDIRRRREEILKEILSVEN